MLNFVISAFFIFTKFKRFEINYILYNLLNIILVGRIA